MLKRLFPRQGGMVGAVLLVVLFIIVLNLTIGALAAEYLVEFWASQSKGVPVDIPFFPHAMLIGLFLGELAIPAALITLLIAPFM